MPHGSFPASFALIAVAFPACFALYLCSLSTRDLKRGHECSGDDGATEVPGQDGGGRVQPAHATENPQAKPKHESALFLGFLVSENGLLSLLPCWHGSAWNQLLSPLLGSQSKVVLSDVHSSALEASEMLCNVLLGSLCKHTHGHCPSCFALRH